MDIKQVIRLIASYLLTGHKNMLRPVTPGKPWANADGSPLRLADTFVAGSAYDSGATFDWTLGKVTAGGSTQDLFYVFGGWMDPAQLDTIWRGGFTGELGVGGNYDCARCHATGYKFGPGGPLPVASSTDFSRVPLDYDPALPASPQASWAQDGVTCERCHVVSDGNNNHVLSTIGGVAATIRPFPTKAQGPGSTALCMECHRQELVDTTANAFTFSTDLQITDGGSCADGTDAEYATCVDPKKNKSTWNFAPFFDNNSGPAFLNSPHGRFEGAVTLLTQNSNDMRLSLGGVTTSTSTIADTSPFDSHFSDSITPQGATVPITVQGGCTTCHDPHVSKLDAVTVRTAALVASGDILRGRSPEQAAPTSATLATMTEASPGGHKAGYPTYRLGDWLWRGKWR